MLSLYLPRALDRFMTAAPAAIRPARRAARACLVPLIASLACLGLPHAAHASTDGTQREFATGASPQPVAGNAEPAAKGTVARLLINPYGQVDGLWLSDGTIVRCSPRLGQRLAEAVHPGDEVSVSGEVHAPDTVSAQVVRNETRGGTIAEPAGHRPGRDDGQYPPAFVPPPQVQPLEPLQVQGRIEAVLRDRRREANGVILSDGSIVRFPPYTMPFVVHPGQPFAAAGNGTRNQFGVAVDATRVGRSLRRLQPLYAGMY